MVVGGRLVFDGVTVWVMAEGEGVETTEETVTCEKVVGVVAEGVVVGVVTDGAVVVVGVGVGVTTGTVVVGVVGATVVVGVGTIGVVEVTATGAGLVEVEKTVTGASGATAIIDD